MLRILKSYIDDEGMQIIEYTKDGINVSHVVRTSTVTDESQPTPTNEELIFAELQWQTMLLEMERGL